MIPTATIRLLLVGATILTFVSGIVWIYKRGAAGAIVTIERQNNAAGTRADEARSRYDRCLDDGKLWDHGAGRCGGPAQDRRK